MAQILANAGATTLTLTWYIDGTATDVDDVTIGIVDGNGDTSVSSGTATTNAGSGVYTYNLADQSNPDILTVTWTDTSSGNTRVQRLEVIGNWLFTEAQARAFKGKDDANASHVPLNSATEYTDATIAAERERLTDDLEYWTGRSWIPRYARIELPGSGALSLNLDHPMAYCRTSDGYSLHRPGRLSDIAVILTATDTSTAVTTSNIKIDGTHLIRTDAAWNPPTYSSPHNVVVEYVYGLPYLVDGVDRVALSELVDRLVPSMWPDRVLSTTSEYGTTRLVQPGGTMSNVSRLPIVNAWVDRHDARLFV